MFKKIIISTIFIVIAVVAILPSSVVPTVQAGTGDNLTGFAWSENIGWISFNSTSDGSSTSYGVNVGSGGLLSGYAWSENLGWLTFNTSQLTGCPSGTCEARLTGTTLTGWARFCAGKGDTASDALYPNQTSPNNTCTGISRTDGWDGWVSLSGASPSYGITQSGNSFQGYSWGSDVVGWIQFNPAFGGVFMNTTQCNDSLDNDGDSKKDFVQVGGTPVDPGCSSALDDNEIDTCPCSSGYRCTSGNVCVPTTVCSDGLDNDADGKYDYDGAGISSPDLGCQNDPFGTTEVNAATLSTVDLKVKRSGALGGYSDGPIIVSPGTDINLQWTSTNIPTSCVATGSWISTWTDADHLGYPTASVETLENIYKSGVYSIVCQNAAGQSVKDTVRVIVNKIVEF